MVLSILVTSESYISDTNEDLILTYRVIQCNPDDLIEELTVLKNNFNKKSYEKQKTYYGDIRDDFNFAKRDVNYKKYSKKNVPQAARLIFLNKTCFNGIYRVNSKGHFNVPMGRYKEPSIYDEKNIYAISDKIQDTKIENKSYNECKNLINSKSLVYLDPPYRPITDTSFTSYTKSNFNDDNQRELAEFFRDISDMGAKVILSNSDPHNRDENDNFFDDLYKGFNIKRVPARRFVNRDGNNRGPICEILVRNYWNKGDKNKPEN